ncbi:hypothetical protein Agub_g655, partial [Astrephomene gubernaculifera]
SPLLGALSGGGVQEVYSPGLLVPLAAPDFSMPYNVMCLSSTLLAVYFGVVLNLLTRRPRETGEGDGGGSKHGAGTGGSSSGSGGGSDGVGSRRIRRRKAMQAVVVVVVFTGLAVYLDAELRESIEGVLEGLGLHVRQQAAAADCGAQACFEGHRAPGH